MDHVVWTLFTPLDHNRCKQMKMSNLVTKFHAKLQVIAQIRESICEGTKYKNVLIADIFYDHILTYIYMNM